jgi:hypothetical protein
MDKIQENIETIVGYESKNFTVERIGEKYHIVIIVDYKNNQKIYDLHNFLKQNNRQDIVFKLNSVLKQFIPEELFVLNEIEINTPINIKYDKNYRNVFK